jgi:hypothetical protein
MEIKKKKKSSSFVGSCIKLLHKLQNDTESPETRLQPLPNCSTKCSTLNSGEGAQRTWESSPIRELNDEARATTPCHAPVAPAGRHQHLPATRAPASAAAAGTLTGPWTSTIKTVRRSQASTQHRQRGGNGINQPKKGHSFAWRRRYPGACAPGEPSDDIHRQQPEIRNDWNVAVGACKNRGF